MKKIIKVALFLCALSSVAYSNETAVMNSEEQKAAMNILDKMRDKIEKEDKERAKAAKEAEELARKQAEEAGVPVETAQVATEEASEKVVPVVQAKKEVKPKTEIERLELTRKKALEKLDFYERVVRSVAREEAEVAGYYEIMNEETAKPSIMDEQSTPAEVPQAATSVEVQQ